MFTSGVLPLSVEGASARDHDVATRDESLAILTGLARDGRVAAAIALARELRGEQTTGDLLDDILKSR